MHHLVDITQMCQFMSIFAKENPKSGTNVNTQHMNNELHKTNTLFKYVPLLAEDVTLLNKHHCLCFYYMFLLLEKGLFTGTKYYNLHFCQSQCYFLQSSLVS